MASKRQLSFAGGEITPALYGRVDLIKYATGLKTCKNFMVMRHGGVTNRAGTTFIAEVNDSSKAVRIIPFIFNDQQTYVIELGDLYLRVHRQGALLTETSKNITGITQANPCVVTIVGHGYTTGDEITISSVEGMTELNNRNFKVTVVSSNTISLQYMGGAVVDSTAFNAYISSGTAARIYQVTTPYVEDDIFELQHNQSADIITLTHSSYPPKELGRAGHIDWSINNIVFGPTINAPTNLVSNSGGSAEFYKITAIDATTGEESLPSEVAGSTSKTSTLSWDGVQDAGQYAIYRSIDGVYGWIGVASPNSSSFTAVNISSITRSGLVATVTTAAVHGLTTNDIAEIKGVDQAGYNGLKKVTVVSTTVFTYTVLTELTTPATGTMTVIETSTSFKDDSYKIDVIDTPPEEKLFFTDNNDYPTTSTYYQQRRLFANTNNDPEGVWGSKSGLNKNLLGSTPIQDDDGIKFSLLGREVNEITHLLDIGKLLMFTTSGEWLVTGDSFGILTPTAINPKQQSANGSGMLAPLIVNDTALYVQARGSVVRDLGFDFASDGYKGDELSIFAAHLFDNYTIVGWAYQQIPHSIVWVVRDDGVLLGLTYIREHQLWGWHRHEFTGGFVESVCVVPEGTEDILYLTIRRTINGRSVRYIERMNTRKITDIKDMIFTDSSLSIDGTNTGSTTMTLSGGTDWDYNESLDLTASASFFTANDIGNQIWLTDSDGNVIRFTINAYTSPTVVVGKPNKTVPSVLRNTAVSTWSKAFLTLSGLWHLEGEDVSIVGDGFVVSNPNNSSYTTKTVVNGSVTLDQPHVKIHVGLPYISDLETLNIDNMQGPTLTDRRKHVNKVTAHVESSRGLFAGTDENSLFELKQREYEGYDEVIALKTGIIDINIPGEWNKSGKVLLRQVDPMPLSILSIVPSGYIAG